MVGELEPTDGVVYEHIQPEIVIDTVPTGPYEAVFTERAPRSDSEQLGMVRFPGVLYMGKTGGLTHLQGASETEINS